MKRKLFEYFIVGIIVLSMVPSVALAAKSLGLGTVASNLMDPVSVMADFLHSACVLVGGAFLFASIIKYFEHRRSPTMVPMSTVVFLLIAGLVLVSLPLINYVSTNGFPYTLIRFK
ncbi:hypothetical protein AQUSIP_15460 [Aquicella siphonis]|uniref:DUF4134 domain-containing protein n=1 Tax=Aquicella siphonis TaxID=254247 RepID=A0A5E4PGR9_9COXI|nr:hypothetical protein [Aquicella siphonis]VVC76240.1 hypothetical protein AQUSIP_15460 [Aquicella siphonis]